MEQEDTAYVKEFSVYAKKGGPFETFYPNVSTLKYISLQGNSYSTEFLRLFSKYLACC